MIIKALKRVLRQAVVTGFPLLTAVAVAQAPAVNTCTPIVQAALQAANDSCAGTTRNQVCYGNAEGIATPADGVDDLQFENAGDIAALIQLKALQLSPLDLDTDEWGVALMQLQATIPDTLPGQNVTFLLFGDVNVEENTGEQARIDAITRQPANLRLGPNTTGPVIGSVPADAAVVATGRTVNAAGQTWVRVRYEEYRTRTGWILGELLEGELDALPDVANDSLTYSPMQAFYFRTGIGQTQCADAPVNGVVVQTPQGLGKVNFNVNGIDVALGSTAFIASPEDESNTCLSLITGSAELRSNGAVINLFPGERSCTVLNEDGTAGRPGAPQPFDPVEMASIAPVLEILPDQVEIPNPAPIRTPTPIATVVRATQVAPTLTPTNTEFPGGPTNPPPVSTSAPNPTPTAPGSTRFANIDGVFRHGFRVDFISSGGPDTPSSFAWDFGDGNSTNTQGASHTYTGGNYGVNLAVCWSDGECIHNSTSVSVPPCAVDYNMAASVTVSYGGSGIEYDLRKTDEFCGQINLGVIAGPPGYSGTGHVGETWTAEQVGGGPIINLFFIADTSPQNANVP